MNKFSRWFTTAIIGALPILVTILFWVKIEDWVLVSLLPMLAITTHMTLTNMVRIRTE